MSETKFPRIGELLSDIRLTMRERLDVLMSRIPQMLMAIKNPKDQELYQKRYHFVNQQYSAERNNPVYNQYEPAGLYPRSLDEIEKEIYTLYGDIDRYLNPKGDIHGYHALKSHSTQQLGGDSYQLGGDPYLKLYKIYKNKYLRLKNYSQIR